MQAADLIFVLSLPRSGSTLLQRVIAQSPHVRTVPEPWVLLPLLQLVRSDDAYAAFGYAQLRRALADLPIGATAYHGAVREAALHLYGALRAASGSDGDGDGDDRVRFLDKTPRYAAYAEELLRTFPESRVVVLWRNPLAVIASIMTTWNEGRWNLYNYRVDLYDGLRALVDVQRRHPERIHAVRYEDLVTDPTRTVAGVFRHLDLPFDEEFVTRGVASRLPGRMGDKTGQFALSSMSAVRLTGYEHGLCNPLRRGWARAYLDWLGDDALTTMGYTRDETIGALDRLPMTRRYLASDAARWLWGQVAVWAEPQVIRDKLGRRRRGLPPVRHP